MANEMIPNEESVDYKILSDEEMVLSDEELADATGGVMIYSSQRMRATCGDCVYSFYVLVLSAASRSWAARNAEAGGSAS